MRRWLAGHDEGDRRRRAARAALPLEGLPQDVAVEQAETRPAARRHAQRAQLVVAGAGVVRIDAYMVSTRSKVPVTTRMVRAAVMVASCACISCCRLAAFGNRPKIAKLALFVHRASAGNTGMMA